MAEEETPQTETPENPLVGWAVDWMRNDQRASWTGPSWRKRQEERREKEASEREG